MVSTKITRQRMENKINSTKITRPRVGQYKNNCLKDGQHKNNSPKGRMGGELNGRHENNYPKDGEARK